MNVHDDLPPDDDQDTGLDEDAGTGADDGQGDDKLALLEQQIAELKAQNTRLDRDFKSGVGRLQSIVTRLESGRGDPDALQRQFNSEMSGVRNILDAILQDENISDESRARARSAIERAKSESDLAAVKAKLEALEGGGRRVEDDDVLPRRARDFENAMVFAIEQAGLDPDDPMWDWAGAATQVFVQQGEAAGQAYFRKKIGDARATQQASERRQSRKESAGKGGASTAAEGGSTRLLDPANNKEQNLKTLASLLGMS